MTSGITCNFLVDGAFVRFLKDCQLASHPIKNQFSYDRGGGVEDTSLGCYGFPVRITCW